MIVQLTLSSTIKVTPILGAVALFSPTGGFTPGCNTCRRFAALLLGNKKVNAVALHTIWDIPKSKYTRSTRSTRLPKQVLQLPLETSSGANGLQPPVVRSGILAVVAKRPPGHLVKRWESCFSGKSAVKTRILRCGKCLAGKNMV